MQAFINLLHNGLVMQAHVLASICDILADFLSDVEDTRNALSDTDFAGTSGISETGLREPVTFDAKGDVIGVHSGTRIIG